MNNEVKHDINNPGTWGSGGALVTARRYIDGLYSSVEAMKKQFDEGKLDIKIAQDRIGRIKRELQILEDHVKDPNKHD